MEKRNVLWLIPGIVFALVTVLFMTVAANSPDQAMVIFKYFAVVLIMIILATCVYMAFFRVETMERRRRDLCVFIETLDAPAVVWDSELSCTVINKSLQELLKAQSRRAYSADILLMLFPKNMLSRQGIESIINNSGEYYAIAEDESVYTILWNTSTFYENKKSGKKLLVSVGFDVTEQRTMETQLRASQERFALSMELSEIGIVISTADNRSFHISKQLQSMLGFKKAIVTADDIRSKVYAKDMVLFEAYLKAITTPKELERSKGIHMIELRLLSASGEYRWYQHRYKVMKRDDSFTIGGSLIDVTEAKQKDRLIERMAYTDEVTGLFNRNRLMLVGQQIYEGSRLLGLSYWLIVLDIDRFHMINDTYGYSGGNEVLKKFGAILRRHVGENGVVARIGADNYVLIIKDVSDADFPIDTVTAVQNEFSELSLEGYEAHKFTCSAGFARMPLDGSDFAEVFDRAEFALSSRDKTKNGEIIGYNDTDRDTVIVSNQLEKALADALDNNELEMFYQPKIDLSTGKIIGAEALVRWRRKDGSLVMPSKFVPVAESAQMISRISRYALYESCRQNVEWMQAGLPPIVISINLTSVDLYENDICKMVSDVLAKTGMPNEYLEIELTETLALKDIDKAIRHMNELRSMGIKIAMDDFGTGYSSLSYIQKLPITMLKLDRSFINPLETDPVSREIVSAVIRIAKAKGIEIIAEGIENASQADILRESGCNYGQGYFFAKPLPAKDMGHYLHRTS
ncbi:MAG: EAL domain-containing protein [Oscillospiraceae bacterium]|nr:EAL domain-containing protein [Oscillospiraceae bacterium]